MNFLLLWFCADGWFSVTFKMVFEMCAFVLCVYGFLLDFKLSHRVKMSFLILNLFISVFEFSSVFVLCVCVWFSVRFKMFLTGKLNLLVLNLIISVFEFSTLSWDVCVIFCLVKKILTGVNGLLNVEFDHFSIWIFIFEMCAFVVGVCVCGFLFDLDVL